MTRWQLIEKAGKAPIKLTALEWLNLYISENKETRLLTDESYNRLESLFNSFRLRLAVKYKKAHRKLSVLENDDWVKQKIIIELNYQELQHSNKGLFMMWWVIFTVWSKKGSSFFILADFSTLAWGHGENLEASWGPMISGTEFERELDKTCFLWAIAQFSGNYNQWRSPKYVNRCFKG